MIEFLYEILIFNHIKHTPKNKKKTYKLMDKSYCWLKSVFLFANIEPHQRCGERKKKNERKTKIYFKKSSKCPLHLNKMKCVNKLMQQLYHNEQ